MLERDLEQTCRKFAVHDLRALSRKMNGMGFRGWPDRLFIRPPWSRGLRTLWVEFKLPGEEPTPIQARIHRDLRARGERVEVIDNEADFIALLGKVWGPMPASYAKKFKRKEK